MTWTKSPPHLLALFKQVRPSEAAGVQHRTMFGCPCCFVNGQMFMVLHEGKLVLRLPEADRAALLAMPGAAPFAPTPGRGMREYVTVPPAMLVDGPELRGWVERALTYAASLPPRERKPRATRRTKRAAA